jgi:hypothetical protein
MRDLTVADLHTYYVIAGTSPVLVHNCGGSIDDHSTTCECASGGRPRGTNGRYLDDPNSGGGSDWNANDRRAAWREHYEDPDSPLTPSERAEVRMRGWAGPQRNNPWTGERETMELSHEPVARQDGGTVTVPRWPDDHAAIDPSRFLAGNRIPFTNRYPGDDD